MLVEELTKSVLESGLLREEGDRYVLNGALSPFAIPTSLHDSLMARLDRLASIRHVAQIGAAIGREFSYGLLRAVSRLADAELQTALARLVASELVFQRAAPPEAIYTFKHALVQDAAHGSLLRSARQQLHAQIAASLETILHEHRFFLQCRGDYGGGFQQHHSRKSDRFVAPRRSPPAGPRSPSRPMR